MFSQVISLSFEYDFIPETQRKFQEAEEHAQETGRKLQILMDTVSNQQQSGPHPIPRDSSTSISAQRKLQWQQSSQGNSKICLRMVVRKS